MREQAIVDLEVLFRRFAHEVLHPLDYPPGLVSRSEPDPHDRSTYELTRAGAESFHGWLKDQGIVYINMSGKPPELREVPVEQIEP